jgi:hypothetical protein
MPETKQKSSAIDSVSFDAPNNVVVFTFTSNPAKVYPYDVAEGNFDFVVESFNTTTSLGTTYHKLVNSNIIKPQSN